VADWRTEILNGARRTICAASDTLGGIFGLFGNLYGDLPAATLFETLSQIYRSVCNDEPPNYASEGIPFVGGQCPARYSVTVSYRPVDGVWRDGANTGTNNPRVVANLYWGPIGGVRARLVSGGAGQPEAAYAIDVLSHGNAPQPSTPRRPTQDYDLLIGSQAVRPGTATVEASIVSVVRLDAQPDDCGNLPIAIPPPPPNYNINNTTIIYQNNDGVDVTVPVVFFVGQAFFDANLNLQIPVNLTVNANVSFPITFNLSTGGFTFNFQPTFNNPNGSPTTQPDGTGGDGRRPSDYTFDSPPPPPPSGDEFDNVEPPEEPTTERVIRGVGITATITNPNGKSVIFQSGANPDIFVPDLGMVQFLIRVGNSVFWTNNIRVLNQRAFIECPWVGGAIDVAVTPRSGVTWQLTPVYGKSELANAQTG